MPTFASVSHYTSNERGEYLKQNTKYQGLLILNKYFKYIYDLTRNEPISSSMYCDSSPILDMEKSSQIMH